MTIEERRKYSRIAFRAPAHLVFPDNTVDAVVMDLSLKGALVRVPTDTPTHEHTICKLHVHLGNTEDDIDMDVRLMHIEGRYVGMHCLSIDLDSVTHLRRLVELNLGDPGLLDREFSALVADE